MRPKGLKHQEPEWQRALLAEERKAYGSASRWAEEVARYRYYGFSEDEIRDIVQLTLIGFWREASRDGLREDIHPKHLVKKIAARRCIDLLRYKRRMVELEDSVADRGLLPDEKARLSELRRNLWIAVASLRPACRELVRWRIVEELPFAEIARRQGCAEVTSKVKYLRCKQAIRRFLEARHVLD